MPWKKTNPRSWGSSITPNFEGFFPKWSSLFERPQKRWRDGADRIEDMEATAAEDPPSGARTRCKSRCCPARRDVPSGSRQPTGRDERGSVMKVKHFQDPRCDRPDDSVQLGANLCARRNRCPPVRPPGQYSQIAEPQQFVIASGTYLASPSSAGAVSP